jgi:CheY-like chemotaxis protein
MLRLTIRDPGPAIDPVGRARLFQPFVQLGDGVASRYAGTGLGLAICQTLAGLLGGEIGYEATEDGGNAFWVRLAFDLPAELRVASKGPRPIYPRSRVLLVEDIRANQLVVATLLRREGHMVDVAASGSAAIRAVARQPYDLVLMDIFMPGMTGIEATRQIRSLPGPAGRVPICAVTGNVAPEDRARCEAAGMNDMLVKPVELDALIAVLGRLVWRDRPANPSGNMTEPSGASPAQPLLKPSRLAELRANLMPAVLSDLVEQSITELTERLTPLRAALSAGDGKLIEAQAHAMAGLAGSYAMAALEARLHAIVEAIRGGTTVPGAAAADLDALLARSAGALRRAVDTEMAR